MTEPKMDECQRQNTCFDCDDAKCWGHGNKGADCPKWICTNVPPYECERCGFIDRHIEHMRAYYRSI